MHGGDGGGGYGGGHSHGGDGGGFGGHHHHHSSNDGNYGDLTPGGSSRRPSTGRFWITAICLIAVFGLILLSSHLH